MVRDRVEFWSVLAEETSRDVRADIAGGPLPVRMTATDLAACVDTLLGNVFAHTPDGTAFAVTLTALPGGGRGWWSPTMVRGSLPPPSPDPRWPRAAPAAAARPAWA